MSIVKNREKIKYYIGVDVGTNSVGWAVIDENGYLLNKGKHHLWGSRLFDQAQTAQNRRNYRSSRRRYNKRRERIRLLQMIMSDMVLEVDSSFFIRLEKTTFLDKEDKKAILKDNYKMNYNLFCDEDYNDKDYFKNYPTIYHLRKKLCESDEKADPRLIYLALHHIIKYRGNFLYNTDNFSINSLNIKEKIKEIFEEIYSTNKNINLNIEDITEETYQKLENALLLKSLNDKKVILKELLNNHFSKDFTSEFIKLILGNKFDISKLFNIELEEEIKLSFKGNDYDENYSTYERVLGDQITILVQLKELYDILFLKNIFGSSQEVNISSLMIEKYDKHHHDLNSLKKLLKSNNKAYKELFKDKNKDKENEEQCLYTKYINNKITYD